MNSFRNSLAALCCLVLIIVLLSARADAQQQANDSESCCGLSRAEAFSRGSMDAGWAFGGGIGPKLFGSCARHDLVIGSIGMGRIMTGTICPNTWHEGNLELRAEIFGGGQINDGAATFAGLTPFVRFNFTGFGRLVPFLEGGAGVSYTDISRPDLSDDFQFNLQAGLGVEYFFCSKTAATFETRLLHFSDAELTSPNHGANSVVFMLGLIRFL